MLQNRYIIDENIKYNLFSKADLRHGLYLLPSIITLGSKLQ